MGRQPTYPGVAPKKRLSRSEATPKLVLVLRQIVHVQQHLRADVRDCSLERLLGNPKTGNRGLV